jgi:hypothetical protein
MEVIAPVPKMMEIYKGSKLYGVYSYKDAEALMNIGSRAKELWYAEWLEKGKEDIGSCCLGKGLAVYYLEKGFRVPKKKLIANCNWVQGNISASKSKGSAEEYLKALGIEFWYDDGVMD